ncbi:MAG TPA: hypothetical protein VKB60_08490, partial [Terriglobales bacterium]|nr:hypothetical protein [Terriglobales bacterium]
ERGRFNFEMKAASRHLICCGPPASSYYGASSGSLAEFWKQGLRVEIEEIAGGRKPRNMTPIAARDSREQN